MDALTLASLASLEQARQLNKAYAEIQRLQVELETKTKQVDDILTAYRAAMDAQLAARAARNKADHGAGCYDMAAFPAWEKANDRANAATFQLFEVLDKAAYPEKQTSR